MGASTRAREMIPAVSATLPAGKGPTPNSAPSGAVGQNTPQGSGSGLAGEAGAAKLRPETARAVDPARQTAVAPRLRDQETAERTDRRSLPDTGPTGPAPAFAETFLQRAARLAFVPPDAPVEARDAEQTEQPPEEPEFAVPAELPDRSQIARFEAAVGFATARSATESTAPGEVDVRE